jgi:hypothetical protein
MKRLIIGSVASFFILSGFASCGKAATVCSGDSLLDKAQLCPDRSSLGFAQEFGSGTLIGTKPQDTISIRNGGIADLHITTASLAGDPEFSLSIAYDLSDGGTGADIPATITGDKNIFLRVIFAPTKAKAYTGTITVASDAENTPSVTFPVSGCGIPADGGVSPCYRDGGL